MSFCQSLIQLLKNLGSWNRFHFALTLSDIVKGYSSMVSLDNLELRYGPKVIFGDVSALIGPRDRIGLVGSNGAGKSTLLRVLMDEESLDGGKIERSNYVTIGYLPQEGIVASGRSLFDEVAASFEAVQVLQGRVEEASAKLETLDPSTGEYNELLELIGGWEHQLEELEAHKMKSKVETILQGLGFAMSDMERDVGEFSGGWQMRIALAKLLLREPSLLLLDEPTNHLDLDSLRWLENYLKKYEGALLIVSHDRTFLDKLSNKTFALSLGNLTVYAGNYTFYEVEREKRQEITLKAYKNQQRQIEKTEQFIERFRYKATKAKQVQSREKALNKVERIEIEQEESAIAFTFPAAPRSGHEVIKLENVHKAYEDLIVYDGLDLSLERGNRLAVVGVNGAGKSTLARIMAGLEEIQNGTVTLGHQVKRAYFAQHQANELDASKDVLQTLEASVEGEIKTNLRTILGSFLFRGDDVFKKVKVLSGGEKSRLALARMLVQPSNLMILDEPTNHLDMQSKAVLQQGLMDCEGTLVLVSHDRDFLDPLIDQVLEVSKSGIRIFLGTMSEYIAKIEEEEAQQKALITNGPKKSNSQISQKERRRIEAERRKVLGPLKKKVTSLETKIADYEKEIASLEKAMADPEFFKKGEETTKGMQRYDRIKAELEQAYADWEEATETLAKESEQ